MSVFKELQQDPAVCSNCFRRTHQIWTPRYIPDWVDEQADPIRDSVDDVLQDKREPLPQTDKVPKLGTGRDGGMTRVCSCGVFRNSSTVRPLTKKRTLKCTRRIMKRLEERDAEFDADALFDTVRELKSNPDKQFKDDKIFKKAVDSAT